MAVDQLNTTTLSEALDSGTPEFAVASTASIAEGDIIVCREEAMQVQAIPTSGRVQVLRGVSGTLAVAQPSGQRVFTGTPDKFKAIRDSANALVGSNATLPQYLLPGQRARDGAGNEYVLLDLTFSGFNGVAVLISRDGLFTATAFASGGAGSIGILAEEGTSAQYVWAQIYGAKSYVQFTSGSSLMTSTGIIQPATTASVPTGALLGRTTSQGSSEFSGRVLGLWPTSAITTATTAATSATGFQASVWMQYPWMERAVSS